MPSLARDLEAFILREREEFSTETSNVFAFVFGDVLRYYEFTELILTSYRGACDGFASVNERHMRQMDGLAGGASPTTEVERTWEESSQCQKRVHLQVESYYVFAAILLDRIAAVTQYYFGPSSTPWKSFDGLRRYFVAYAQNKQLEHVPVSLQSLLDELCEDVSKFRHEHIVHKHDVDYRRRLVAGTSYDPMSREAWFNLALLYPQPGEQTVMGVRPPALHQKIEGFITVWLALLRSNESKRVL